MTFPYRGLCYSIPATSPDPHNRGELTHCDLFTEAEEKAIDDASTTMDLLFTNMDRSLAVGEALEELKNELNSLHSDNKYSIARVDRRFRAYVMEFRLFLDHWKKYIGDLRKQDEAYGMAYEKLYQDVTSEVYDHNDSYVLSTVLRNYVVHGYDSINHAHIGMEKKEIFIFRDNLFKIDMAKSAVPVIQRQAEEIDLLAVAEESFKALQSVQDQLISFQITEDIGQAAVTLLNAKKRIDDAGIVSGQWLFFGEQKPMDVEWNGKITAGIDLAYRKLDWDVYIMVAVYIANLWQKGRWGEIQREYGLTTEQITRSPHP